MKKIKVFSLLSVLLLGACLVASPLLVTRAEDRLRSVSFDIEEPSANEYQGYIVVEHNDANQYDGWKYDVFFWSIAASNPNGYSVPCVMDIMIERGRIIFCPDALTSDGTDVERWTLSRYSGGKFDLLISLSTINKFQ